MSSLPIKRAIIYGVVFAALNLIFLDTPLLKSLITAALFGLSMGALDTYFEPRHGKKIKRDMNRIEQGTTLLKKGRKRK